MLNGLEHEMGLAKALFPVAHPHCLIILPNNDHGGAYAFSQVLSQKYQISRLLVDNKQRSSFAAPADLREACSNDTIVVSTRDLGSGHPSSSSSLLPYGARSRPSAWGGPVQSNPSRRPRLAMFIPSKYRIKC